MPSAAMLRRPSDLAHDLIKVVVGKITGKKDSLTAEDTRRSRSTGDLDQADYMLMDFNAPTTSAGLPLAPHFDDCDRVPMVFDKNGAHLLKQTSRTIRMMNNGRKRLNEPVTLSQIHLAQLWFYPDLTQTKAEDILVRTGLVPGSFIIRTHEGRHLLSMVTKQATVLHLIISCCFVKGVLKFKIDVENCFSNLAELVDHYQCQKGFVLPNKLKNGISRGIRLERRADEIIKAKKHSI